MIGSSGLCVVLRLNYGWSGVLCGVLGQAYYRSGVLCGVLLVVVAVLTSRSACWWLCVVLGSRLTVGLMSGWKGIISMTSRHINL